MLSGIKYFLTLVTTATDLGSINGPLGAEEQVICMSPFYLSCQLNEHSDLFKKNNKIT